mgnify:CR=1 FL=1
MNSQEVLSQITGNGDPVNAELFAGAKEVTLPRNTVVFHQGDQCSNYLLVLDGAVKVLSRAENGREIVLYRLGAGDSCVLTTSCLFGNVPYPAEGITESEVLALALPATAFKNAKGPSLLVGGSPVTSCLDHGAPESKCDGNAPEGMKHKTDAIGRKRRIVETGDTCRYAGRRYEFSR